MSSTPRTFSIDESAAPERPLPVAPANAPWVFAYHRTAWTVRADGRVVPALIPIPMAPGFGGIGESLRGNYTRMWDKVVEQSRGRDLLLIHPNIGPDELGADAGALVSYEARDPQTKQPGTHWAPRWETPRMLSESVVTDYELWDAYLDAWHAKSGLPLRPDDDVIAAKIADLEATVQRAIARAGRETPRSEAIGRTLSAWRALLDEPAAVTDATPPAPPKAPKAAKPPASAKPATLTVPTSPPGDGAVDATGNGFVAP